MDSAGTGQISFCGDNKETCSRPKRCLHSNDHRLLLVLPWITNHSLLPSVTNFCYYITLTVLNIILTLVYCYIYGNNRLKAVVVVVVVVVVIIIIIIIIIMMMMMMIMMMMMMMMIIIIIIIVCCARCHGQTRHTHFCN